MLKFATFQITSASLVGQDGMSRTATFQALGHRAVFDYQPRPGFLYVRSRAISSRCNDNYDEFPPEEIKTSYRTFIGKPVFVNHHNDNHRRARGVVIDAALHQDRNPDGSPDTWAEVLMEVDAVRFPILAKAILAGHVDRTSMGTDVAYSICSVCANKATSPAEYCAHIPRMKGQRIYRTTDLKTGKREGVLVREVCYGLKFFENSLLVEEPADPTAYFLGVDDRGMATQALAKTATGDMAEHHRRNQALVDVYNEALTNEQADRWRRRNIRPVSAKAAARQIRPVSTWIGNHPQEPSLYWRAPKSGWEVHIHSYTPSRELREGYGAQPSQSVRLQHRDSVGSVHPDNVGKGLPTPGSWEMGRDGIKTVNMWGERPPTIPAHVQKHIDNALDEVDRHAQNHADLYGQMAEQNDIRSDLARVPHDMAAEQKSREMFENLMRKTKPDEPDEPYVTAAKTAERIEFSPEEQEFHRQMRDAGEMRAQMGQHARTRAVNLADPHDLKAHLIETHGWTDDDFWRNSHDPDHPLMSPGLDEDRPLSYEDTLGAHHHEHDVEYPGDYPHTTLGDSHFHHGSKTAAAEDDLELHKALSDLEDLLRKDNPHLPRGSIMNAFDKTLDKHVPRYAPGTFERHVDEQFKPTSGLRKGAPFAGYDDFEDCVRQNRDKDDPEAYCGSIKHKVEDSKTSALAYLFEDFAHAAALEAHLAARSAADKYFEENPPHVDHLLERFHAATPEQHESGMNWYQDAHHIAKGLGDGDTAKAAGLIGVYSAGTPVAPNYHYASRSLRHNTAVGGTTDKLPTEHSDFHGRPNASELQSEQATRMLNGEHHSKVLFSPKVSNYAHLIEHGDDEPSTPKERVVIDRHAVSAATGRRVTDKEFGALNLSSNQSRVVKDEKGKTLKDENGDSVRTNDYGQDRNSRYARLADTYREAAAQLRAQGHDVKAHQVQAVTWLVQKARNDADDEARAASDPSSEGGRIKGRQKSVERQRNAWESHYDTEHPEGHRPAHPRSHWGAKAWTPTQADLLDFEQVISVVGFGETKAPADVDTLRDQECPVCGERDSYDGNSCQVCGFDAPPAIFRDPDLDLAKNLDLRKDMADGAGTLPGAAQDGMTPGEQDANGGMPGAVPGTGMEGSDAMPVPVDPSQVDADGTVTPTTDPAQIAQQQMDTLQAGQPLTPDMLGPNGEVLAPDVDPQAATGHFNTGGEAFTPGPNDPNAPEGPEGPQEPLNPEDLDQDGQEPPEVSEGQQGAPTAQDEDEADGQAQAPEPGTGDPGTPEDGTPDLQCPNCGFSSDAQRGQSVDMDDQAMVGGGGGTMAGDVCPQCGQALLMSVGEVEQMAGAPKGV